MGNDWFHEYFINELKAIGRKPTSNMQREVVDSLPSSGNEQTIYFVKNDSSSSNNHYDEYVWISSSSTFEKIGSAQIDGSTTNPDWNQNDDTQPDYVKNRTHYEESIYVDYALSMRSTTIVGFTMPEVGETITVKINGVESAETVKEAESGLYGFSYKYIGNIDFDSLPTGGTGWFVGEFQGSTVGLANPDTTISLECIVVHKINNKFINYDGFARTFDYYFKNYTLYKTLYDDTGNECLLYTCVDFILPDSGLQLLGFMEEIGLSKIMSTGAYSCLVVGHILGDTRYYTKCVVLGTNVDDMETTAASSGYTHTTKPNA